MSTIAYSLPITAGNGANFPLLNITNPTFALDADYTATQADLASILQIVKSTVALTTPRQITYPLVNGLTFLVANATTGGQSIKVIGTTGVGVDIPSASSTWVYCDGTDWHKGSQTAAPGGVTPAGSGFPHVTGGSLDVNARAVDLNSADVANALPPAKGGTGLTIVGAAAQVIGTLDGATVQYLTITQDMIAAGFAPSLALASGSAATLVPGGTWTPTFNANPAPNAAGVSNPTISDNQGHTNVVVAGGNPVSPPVPSFTLNVPGTVVVWMTETKGGVTKNTNQVGVTWANRTFQGVGGAGATGAAATGTNATLSGGAAGGTVLAGTGPMSSFAGASFTVNPVNQKVYDLVPAGGAHTYTNGPLPFGMAKTATIAFANENGVMTSWDLYESNFALSGSYIVTRAT